MKEYVVELKTRTPLWTGDVTRKTNSIRETGIIGSLRWWYEILIRELEGKGCGPTNSSCESENHCGVCELFGCTGWARKFRLEIELTNKKKVTELKVGTRKADKVSRDNKSTKQSKLSRTCSGIMDDCIKLKFIPLRQVKEEEWFLLGKTLDLIGTHGALGGRTAQGNGVIEIIDNPFTQVLTNNQQIQFKKYAQENSGEKIPALNDFFFRKYQIEFEHPIIDLIGQKAFWSQNHEDWQGLWNKHSFLPIAFHIRDTLRRSIEDSTKRHNYFGSREGNGRGSKVFVSHGYKISDNIVETRLFGYQVDEISLKKIIDTIEKEKLKKYLFQESYSGKIKSISNISLKRQDILTQIRGCSNV